MIGRHRPGGTGIWGRVMRLVAPVGVGALLVASCGSDAEPAAGDEAPVDEVVEDAEEFAENQADALEEVQEQQGGGSARLVVGDEEWVFDSVLCAFGEEQIGQEGAEFVLSSIQDGLQLYASIDSFGHSIGLDDIEDFENPSVSLGSEGDGFISVDGTSVSAEAEFIDFTGDDLTTTPGTFEATCP